MAGDSQPLSDKFPVVGPDGRPTIYFTQWAQQRQSDISNSVTPDQATQIVIDYIAAHPVNWGEIVGALSAQTDLQTALDTKVNYTDFTNFAIVGGKLNFWEFGGPSPSIAGPGGLFSIGADDIGSGQPYMIWTNADNINFMLLGLYTANTRFSMDGSKSYEFSLTPYVTTHQIFHEGNLVNFTAADDGLTPASGGGTTNFLRADGSWAVPPGSGGGGTTTHPVTFDTTGGAASGAAFDGSVAKTIDYSTLGAAKAGLATGSGLTTAATDKVLGRSSALGGPVEEIACTAAGRALIAGANAAAQRVTLGLVAIAASGSGADLVASSVPYAKIQDVSATDKVLGRSSAGAGVIQEIDCTAAGRALIASANAAAQRATLGVYSIAAVDTAVTPYELSPTKPAAADFTLLNGSAGSVAAVMADYARGVSILQNGSVGATTQTRFARHNTVSAGQAFTMTARFGSIDPTINNGNAMQGNLVLRNSANGRMVVLGSGTGDGVIFAHLFSAFTGNNAGAYSSVTNALNCPWRRIVVDASGNIAFFFSKDGYFWIPMTGSTIANFLGALDEVGIGMLSIASQATPFGTLCHSFTFV